MDTLSTIKNSLFKDQSPNSSINNTFDYKQQKTENPEVTKKQSEKSLINSDSQTTPKNQYNIRIFHNNSFNDISSSQEVKIEENKTEYNPSKSFQLFHLLSKSTSKFFFQEKPNKDDLALTKELRSRQEVENFYSLLKNTETQLFSSMTDEQKRCFLD